MKGFKKYFSRMFTCICAISLLVGCSSKKGSEDTIKIGLNFELSGGAASYGEAELNGVMLAVDEINNAGGIDGKLIEVVKVDNKTDAAEATNVSTKLATKEKVVAILGPATSGATKASIPVANQYKVPIITPSGTDDPLTLDANGKVQPYAFRVCFKDSFQGVTLASFAYNNLNASKAVILFDSSSDYSKGLTKNFKESFVSKGGTIVAEEAFSKGDQEFSPVLTKIKSLDYDVIFIPGYYEESSLIIKQARALGIDVAILGGDGFDSPKLKELAGEDALHDVYFSAHYSTFDEDPKVKEFINKYKAKYNSEPNAFAALGYDTANLLFDAIKRANANSISITEALEATKDLVGVTGTLTMDEYHNPIKSAVVVGLDKGEQVSSVKVNP